MAKKYRQTLSLIPFFTMRIQSDSSFEGEHVASPNLSLSVELFSDQQTTKESNSVLREHKLLLKNIQSKQILNENIWGIP